MNKNLPPIFHYTKDGERFEFAFDDLTVVFDGLFDEDENLTDIVMGIGRTCVHRNKLMAEKLEKELQIQTLHTAIQNKGELPE